MESQSPTPPRVHRTIRLSNRDAAFIGAGAGIFVVEVLLAAHFFLSLTRWIDSSLTAGAVHNPAVLLAAPTQVTVGQPATPAGMATELRNAFYVQGDGGSDTGTYLLERDHVEIHPGVKSYFRRGDVWEGAALLRFHDGHLASITTLPDRKPLDSYWIEPQVITMLFDGGRDKRQVVQYDDLPKNLIDAILSTEDRRFFSHWGVNIGRIGAAALTDFKAERPAQGGSTITMQLARNLFLTPRRTIRRKVEEVFIALLLEHRYTKQRILELYANQIYLGQWGNFGLYGVGDAAKAYFNKDVGSLTLPESAFIAGLIRGPNLYSPYKNPERSVDRRNFVLRQMEECGYIQKGDAETAMATPLKTAPQVFDPRPEGFFVDMVKQKLRGIFSDRELMSRGLRVYTTMDPVLQQAATEAVHLGSDEIDRRVAPARRGKKGTPAEPAPGRDQPQIAMIALDPHTGDVRALVGGRDYSFSQLNHIEARRQPGSAFKPFVYAAALNSAIDGSSPVITTATILHDRPTTFQTGKYDQEYTPRNFKDQYRGDVTVREALTHSLNVPTVSLAQQIGLDKIRNLALAAGFNSQLGSTPALALGAYVATPFEVAGAYTVFANNGTYVQPEMITEVDDESGNTLWRNSSNAHPVLDPRVNYLMVNLMEGVINNGTGAAVRSRGFSLQAAGKTGTSHDGWFAGFTSKLLAVAWVGYDDDRDLNLTGSESALPVWAEFMKRAAQQPYYRQVDEFKPPDGVVTVPVWTDAPPESDVAQANAQNSPDPDADDLPQAGDDGSNIAPVVARRISRMEVFISGTEPPQPAQESTPLPTTDQDPNNPGNPDGAPQANDPPPEVKQQSSIDVLLRVFGSPVVYAAPALPSQPRETDRDEVISPPASTDHDFEARSAELKKLISVFEGEGPGAHHKTAARNASPAPR